MGFLKSISDEELAEAAKAEAKENAIRETVAEFKEGLNLSGAETSWVESRIRRIYDHRD